LGGFGCNRDQWIRGDFWGCNRICSFSMSCFWMCLF
jgi:hypothetical protein